MINDLQQQIADLRNQIAEFKKSVGDLILREKERVKIAQISPFFYEKQVTFCENEIHQIDPFTGKDTLFIKAGLVFMLFQDLIMMGVSF